MSLIGKRHDILGGQSPKQAGIYRIPNFLGVTNGLFDIILGLYGRTSNWTHPDINYAELSRRYQKKLLAESLSQKYLLLDYVTSNWIWHAKEFNPKDHKLWSTFRSIVFHRSLPFDFRPWNTLEGPSDLPHLGLYLWALENNPYLSCSSSKIFPATAL